MSNEEQGRAFQVRGTPASESAPPVFCNFVGLTRLGSEVQFEFIYMDFKEIATTIAQAKSEPADKPTSAIQGQTVVKVVMPAVAFVQTQKMFNEIFDAVNKAMQKSQEVQNERRSAG